MYQYGKIQDKGDWDNHQKRETESVQLYDFGHLDALKAMSLKATFCLFRFH